MNEKPAVTGISWAPADGISINVNNKEFRSHNIESVVRVLNAAIWTACNVIEETAYKESKTGEISTALDAEELDKAKALIEELRREFGQNDSDVIYYSSFLAFMEKLVND